MKTVLVVAQVLLVGVGVTWAQQGGPLSSLGPVAMCWIAIILEREIIKARGRV